MSIILKRETEEDWPKFGETFMSGLKVVMIGFEGISVVILSISALVLLLVGIFVGIPWIWEKIIALHEGWDARKQAKQRSNEEVVMGRIVSGSNEQDVEYGFLAMDRPVGKVDERKEEVDG